MQTSLTPGATAPDQRPLLLTLDAETPGLAYLVQTVLSTRRDFIITDWRSPVQVKASEILCIPLRDVLYPPCPAVGERVGALLPVLHTIFPDLCASEFQCLATCAHAPGVVVGLEGTTPDEQALFRATGGKSLHVVSGDHAEWQAVPDTTGALSFVLALGQDPDENRAAILAVTDALLEVKAEEERQSAVARAELARRSRRTPTLRQLYQVSTGKHRMRTDTPTTEDKGREARTQGGTGTPPAYSFAALVGQVVACA
jgi:hypothetical protein